MGPMRRAAIGAGMGASIGILLVAWSEAATASGEGVLPLLVLTVVLAAFGFVVPLAVEGGRPFLLHQWVPIPPDEILLHATRWYAATGWTSNAAQPAALSFSRCTPPFLPLAVLLLVFGIVPGLLYLFLGSGTQTAAIVNDPLPDGTRLEIVVSSRDRGGQSSAVAFFNSLHQLVGPAIPTALGRG